MTHDERVTVPEDRCPKCGEDITDVDPQYAEDRKGGYPTGHQQGHPPGEHLDWPCGRCGYRLAGPVAS